MKKCLALSLRLSRCGAEASPFLFCGKHAPPYFVFLTFLFFLAGFYFKNGPHQIGTYLFIVLGAVSGVTTIYALISNVKHEEKNDEMAADIKAIRAKLLGEQELEDPRLNEEFEKKIVELEKALDEKGERGKKAKAAFEQGDMSLALQLYEDIRKEEKGKEKEHAETAYNLGNIHFLALRFKDALAAYEDALRLDPDNSLYLNEAGFVAHKLSFYDKATEYFEKALAVDLKVHGLEHPDVARDWNNLGSAWKAKGEYDKAIGYYEKALAVDLRVFGPEHPDTATDWNNLGSAWDSKGDYDKAIEYFEKALAVDLKVFGPEHPKVAIRWNNLGSAWNAKGEYDKAIDYYEKSLAIDLKVYGPEHSAVARDWNNLGCAWHTKGEHDKAIEYFEKALAVDLKVFGPEHPDVVIDWNNLGGAWDSKGEYDKAIGYYEKALAVCNARLGENHPNTKLVKNNLEIARRRGK